MSIDAHYRKVFGEYNPNCTDLDITDPWATCEVCGGRSRWYSAEFRWIGEGENLIAACRPCHGTATL